MKKEKRTKSPKPSASGLSCTEKQEPSKGGKSPSVQSNGEQPKLAGDNGEPSNGKIRGPLSHIFDFEHLPKTELSECTLCGGPLNVTLAKYDRYRFLSQFVVCDGCASVHLTPRPDSSAYRELYGSGKYRMLVEACMAAFGEKAPKASPHETGLQKAAAVCSVFSPYMRHLQTALDIGGGNGGIARALGPRVKTTIVDPACDECPDDIPCEKLKVPIENLGNLDGRKWDVVFCLATVDHVLEPLETLKTIRECMTQYAVIEVVDFPARFHRLGWKSIKVDHPTNISKLGIQIAMERAGLKLTHEHHFEQLNMIAYGCEPDEPKDSGPRYGSAAHVMRKQLGIEAALQ
jgi:hypothetical protein